MEEKSLEEMYSFAFQPHYPKKYRMGEPEANKRHQEKPIDFRKTHQLSVVLDPWANLEAEAAREGSASKSTNRVRHVAITEETLR